MGTNASPGGAKGRSISRQGRRRWRSPPYLRPPLWYPGYLIGGLRPETASNTVFDVEIKTELDQEALDQILDHLRRFPRFFREHRGKKLYGVLAAVKIPPGMRKRALRQGLYLATIRDDVFDVLRPEGFEPRAFPN